MNSQLFSSFERTDASPGWEAESVYATINRRGGVEYENIRAKLEAWYRSFPGIHQNEIRQRFVSECDRSFHSAFLELFTYQLLCKMGSSVEVHPELPNTKKRPDFLLIDECKKPLIAECVVVTEQSDEELASEARRNVLYDAINKEIDCPDFFLSISLHGDSKTAIPISRWVGKIRNWISTLHYEEIVVLGACGRLSLLPALSLEHEELECTITPIARKECARGQVGIRPIGAQSNGEGGFVTSRQEIAKAIKKKAKRYGDLTCSFLVVVNCLGSFVDEQEIVEAVYGNGGVWPPSNNLFKRLSGVLIFRHLLPWSIPRTYIRLFQNPKANVPYQGNLNALPQAKWINNKMEHFSGIHPRELFSLDPLWPVYEVT